MTGDDTFLAGLAEPAGVSGLEESLEKELVRCDVSVLDPILSKPWELGALLTLLVSTDGYENE